MKLKMKKRTKDNKLIYDVFILQIKVETEEKFHNNDIELQNIKFYTVNDDKL